MNAQAVRIAIVMTTHSFGGYEINFLNLAKWFREAGCEVFCFFPEGSRLYTGALEAGLNITAFSKKGKFDFGAAGRLSRHLNEHRIGHMYLGRPSSDAGLAWQCKRNAPGLKAYFNMELEFNSSKKDLWHRFQYRALDWWICPSKFLYDNALERVGIDSKKIIEITSGIEVDRFVAIELKKEECRSLLNLPQTEFIIGIIGRIDPGKGQHHLVAALGILARQGLRPHAAIVGYDTRNEHQEYYQQLMAQADESGVRGQIHLVPFQSEVQVAYRALDAFVMASQREAYGFVTLEAMAASLVVLGTDAGGTRDLIEDQVDGLLWQPENPQALADKLALVLNGSSMAVRLGKAAAEKMQRKFRHDDQVKKLIELFNP